MCASGITVAVEASRNRSGGAKAHLNGLISGGDPEVHGIKEVHVWSYTSLLESLPDRPWLVRHHPSVLEQSLAHQVWWQRFKFHQEAREAGCKVVLNTDAGTVSSFSPAVTMSRDMLSYEPGEINRYGLSRARLRLILLRYVQNSSLRRADGAVFLTHHAARVIQEATGPLERVALIPHGVGAEFKRLEDGPYWPKDGERPISCLYVSNAAPYKHHWMIVRALRALRGRGHDLSLTLAGGGSGPARARLDRELALSDPHRLFVTELGFVDRERLPALLFGADLFIFASSCENMPITLVEAMAAGLPIASSDRGPMPEILGDGGVYFNPEDPQDLAAAVERLLVDASLRSRCARRARELASQYSWTRCANETWAFLRQVARACEGSSR